MKSLVVKKCNYNVDFSLFLWFYESCNVGCIRHTHPWEGRVAWGEGHLIVHFVQSLSLCRREKKNMDVWAPCFQCCLKYLGVIRVDVN